MADHGTSAAPSQDMEEHVKTYQGFLKGAVVLSLLSFYVLVALCAFAFINTGNVLIGFAGLIIGILALIVDMRAGNNWYISAGWLVIFGLFVAVMVA